MPKGVHRIRRATLSGDRWHFYAWRGGPRFWTDTRPDPADPHFYLAFARAFDAPRPAPLQTSEVVQRFLSSPEMPKAERTRQDYRRWALRFADAFSGEPITAFEDPSSRARVMNWRSAWAHSPKQYDMAGTVATRLLNWAWKDAGLIGGHHCQGFRKTYEADRSDILWTPEHRARLCSTAPDWVARLLTAACETGLRPADLVRLSQTHIETTPKGRRIRIRTEKRHRIATLPVTPAMARVIDTTPDARLLILTSARGRPLTPHRASEGLRQWRDKAGLTPRVLGYSLRLQDCRGTAATRLLKAGLSLGDIAAHMGWSLRHAANVIERYALVPQDQTDAMLQKLTRPSPF